MFGFGKKIKELKEKNEKQDANKNIENIIFFIILLIIVVIVINKVWGKDESKNSENINGKVLAETFDKNDNTDNSKNEYYGLQKELEEILSSINGVGKVKVLINYSETSSLVAMYNETVTESSTEEKDTEGGTRNITSTDTQKEIAYTQESGTSKPITEKVIMPTIEGAIITAEGASNANVKADIISAVEAITGLATHKIQVFQMKEI